MRIETASFAKLPVRAYPLNKWSKPAPPAYREHETPVQTIFHFAQYVGLEVLPAATMLKFRGDADYKYCFFQLTGAGESFYTDDFYAPRRDRLKQILLDPATANDRDFYAGARLYLNNFPLYMPGGSYRVKYEGRLADVPVAAKLFRAIDGLFSPGGRRTALHMLARAESESGSDIFTGRAAYHRFCLRAFNELVAKGLTPDELWG
jgi:hypothetical protein